MQILILNSNNGILKTALIVQFQIGGGNYQIETVRDPVLQEKTYTFDRDVYLLGILSEKVSVVPLLRKTDGYIRIPGSLHVSIDRPLRD